MNQLIRESNKGGTHRVEVTSSSSSTSASTVVMSTSGVTHHSAPLKPLENAVYGHIQAVRALGRTEITASEIAAALSVPVLDVINALAALTSKGVKIAG